MDKRWLLSCAAAIAAGVGIGYKLGLHKWEDKETQQALNSVLTLGDLFAETLRWVVEEICEKAADFDVEDFIGELDKRMNYIALVAHEL